MAAILRFRMLMIAAGYADGNDTTSLALRSRLQDGDRVAAAQAGPLLDADDFTHG